MIYVDEAHDWGRRIGRLGPWWCHMTADTKEELHAFAARLGLRRAWFQDRGGHTWHYDLSTNERGGGMRGKAIGMGAKPITLREIGALVNARADRAKAERGGVA